MKLKVKLFISLVLILTFYSCTEKFDINQFSDKSGFGNLSGDTVYIKLTPDWTGFKNRPFPH